MSVTVSVVVPVHDRTDQLKAALASVARQTRPVDQVVVVGKVPPGASSSLAGLPVTRVARPGAASLAAARNVGLDAASSEYVLFLDPGEELTPVAVAAGVDCVSHRSTAAVVLGAEVLPRVGPEVFDGPRRRSLGADARVELLSGRVVRVHAAALYRRDVLVDSGGFDEHLRDHDVHDVHLRLARSHDLARHPLRTASGTGEPGRVTDRVRAALQVHARHKPDEAEPVAVRQAWAHGRGALRDGPAEEVLRTALATGSSRPSALFAAARVSPMLAFRAAAPAALRWTTRHLPGAIGDTVSRLARVPGARPRGRIRLGDLATAEPVDLNFGFGRGTPVDRHYIEDFLHRHADDVHGRVLEIADPTYSKRFGGDRIDQQDVLDIQPDNPAATIVGDVTEAGVLPPAVFDCIVLTQTLHLLYDMAAVVRHLHEALRPGGTLLVTVPGISQMDRYQWGGQWYWSLTPLAVQRLLGDVFGHDLVAVESHGNAFAATAFLQGLAREEVPADRLDSHDPAYPVIVAARALKLP